FAAGLTLAATAYIAYYHVVYQCFFAVAYALAWSDAVRAHRAISAPSPSARYAAAALVAIACVAACAAAAIAITGGTTIMIAGVELSATTPQNAMTAMWVCIAGALVARWRPRVALNRAADWRRLAAVAWRIVAVFLAGALPLVLEAARLGARGEYVSQQYGWRSVPPGIALISPLLGSPVHPLLGSLSRSAYTALGDNFIETVGWMGVVPLLLAAGFKSHTARAWRIVAAAFFVWALGPFL